MLHDNEGRDGRTVDEGVRRREDSMLVWMMQVALSFMAQVALLGPSLVDSLRAELACRPIAEGPCAQMFPTGLLQAADLEAELRSESDEPSFRHWLLEYAATRRLRELLATRRPAAVLEMHAAGDTALALLLLERTIDLKPDEAAEVARQFGELNGWHLTFRELDVDEGERTIAVTQVSSPTSYCNFRTHMSGAERLMNLGDEWRETVSTSCRPDAEARLAGTTIHQVQVVESRQSDDSGEMETQTILLIGNQPGTLRFAGLIATEFWDADGGRDIATVKSVSAGQCNGEAEIWTHTSNENGLNCAGQEEMFCGQEEWKGWVEQGLMKPPDGDLTITYASRMPRVLHRFRRFDLNGNSLGDSTFEIEGPLEIDVLRVRDEAGNELSAFDEMAAHLGRGSVDDQKHIHKTFNDPKARARAICSNRTLTLD